MHRVTAHHRPCSPILQGHKQVPSQGPPQAWFSVCERVYIWKHVPTHHVSPLSHALTQTAHDDGCLPSGLAPQLPVPPGCAVAMVTHGY